MRQQQIRKYRDRAPFRAFDLELTSGTRLRVTHPENMVLAKDIGFVRTPDDEGVVFTPEEVCAVRFARRGGNRSSRNGK